MRISKSIVQIEIIVRTSGVQLVQLDQYQGEDEGILLQGRISSISREIFVLVFEGSGDELNDAWVLGTWTVTSS